MQMCQLACQSLPDQTRNDLSEIDPTVKLIQSLI